MWKSYLQCLSKKGNIHSLYVQYPSRWSDRFHSVFRFDNETDFSLRLTHTNPPRGKQGRLLDRREMVRGAHMETGEQTYVMKVSICRDSNTRWGAGELITTGVPEGGDQEDPAPARACTHAHTHPHPQTDRQRRERVMVESEENWQEYHEDWRTMTVSFLVETGARKQPSNPNRRTSPSKHSDIQWLLFACLFKPFMSHYDWKQLHNERCTDN